MTSEWAEASNRPGQASKSESSWRPKPVPNGSSRKYERETLLSLYAVSEPPAFTVSLEDIKEISCTVQSPCLVPFQPFSHLLGEDINSRSLTRDRKPEAIPDWYREPGNPEASASVSQTSSAVLPGPVNLIEEDTLTPQKPAKKETKPIRVVLSNGSRNVPLDIQLSGTDLVRLPTKPYECEKQSSQQEEPDQLHWEDVHPIPSESWGLHIPQDRATLRLNPDAQPWQGSVDLRQPKYHVTVLQEQLLRGDPFAGIMLETGVMDQAGFVSLPTYSKATEKVWYYKDPQGLTQGPFNSVEMFNWNAAGYFSPELLVSKGTKTHFAPLGLFGKRYGPVGRRPDQKVSRPYPEPQERGSLDPDNATAELKLLLGLRISSDDRSLRG